MKKKQLAVVIAIITFATSLSGCASKYKSVECETPLTHAKESTNYFYLPNSEDLNFDRKIEESGFSFYHKSGLDGRKIDEAVDAVKRVQAFCEVPKNIFLLEDTITHVGADGLWINLGDSAELIGGILLESRAETELPFGVFAGVSANLLENEGLNFSLYSESQFEEKLEEYPYVTELQYPLYTERETTEKERETAWNFAYRLGREWLEENEVEALQTATAESIESFLTENGANLPTYQFIVGDCYYPTQIKTDNLHYYFAYNYDDCEFNEEEFSFQYTVLTDFVKEHETLIEELSKMYAHEGFPTPVDCFFGKVDEYNLAYTDSSSFTQNVITCYTVGRLGYHLVRWVAYYAELSGYTFDKVVNMLFALKYSDPAVKLEYLDYSMSFEGRYSEKYQSESSIEWLKEIRDIYNAKFGESATSDFNVDGWIHSIGYAYNKDTEEIALYSLSFVDYIYDTYGFDTLMMINRKHTSTNIEGKTYDDFVTEWHSWLMSQFTE